MRLRRAGVSGGGGADLGLEVLCLEGHLLVERLLDRDLPPRAFCRGHRHFLVRDSHRMDRPAGPLRRGLPGRWAAAALHLRAADIHGRQGLRPKAARLRHLRGRLLQRGVGGLLRGCGHQGGERPVPRRPLEALCSPSPAGHHGKEGCLGCSLCRPDAHPAGHRHVDGWLHRGGLPAVSAGPAVPPAEDSHLRPPEPTPSGRRRDHRRHGR
mmetsp:Transcript_123462/g.384274  ORF Transcript_123462/g.384274 Transcript_123462/m.384274 type:complete len:211 (-) Transcript_123462:68-700(-)